MDKISNIILHCSDSESGTAVSIDKFHREVRHWSAVGYMGVVLNGYPLPGSYWEWSDGAWEWGRPLNQNNTIELNEVEAHAYGWNNRSVGICMIGKNGKFSMRQFSGARQYIRKLCELWSLTYAEVLGHYEIDQHGKTCPDVDMDLFRAFLVDPHLIDDLIVGQH